nr:MAG TPA: hypothetical protein [Caudoviricetes sp.]
MRLHTNLSEGPEYAFGIVQGKLLSMTDATITKSSFQEFCQTDEWYLGREPSTLQIMLIKDNHDGQVETLIIEKTHESSQDPILYTFIYNQMQAGDNTIDLESMENNNLVNITITATSEEIPQTFGVEISKFIQVDLDALPIGGHYKLERSYSSNGVDVIEDGVYTEIETKDKE